MKATALILAGGRATRMKGVPKCLLPLGDGRSILEHLIDSLTKSKIESVVLGELPAEEVAAWEGSDVFFLPDGEKFGGTARAIAGAEKLLNHRKDDRILLCYGDTFLPGFDYGAACYPGTLTIGQASPLTGNVRFATDGAVYERECDWPMPWLELGATCVRHGDLESIGKFRDLPDWLETRVFRRICIHEGSVLTTGTPDQYDYARSCYP